MANNVLLHVVRRMDSYGIDFAGLLILLLLGALPTWPHSRNWGYYPGGGLGTILIIVVILLVLGRI